MVFYFTATGNSMYVAKQLDCDIYSIPQEFKKQNRVYKADKIGIVCPLFEFSIPDYVKQFIKTSTFETDYFYIIVTYGMHDGAVALRTKQFMDSIGKNVNYINSIIMHDNAIIVFDMDEQRKLEEGKKVDEHIALLKKDIDERKEEIQEAKEEELAFSNGYFKHLEETGPSYTFPLYSINNDCVGCGTCTKVCPTNCIKLVNGQVEYNYTNCIHCMACAQACPTKAIKLCCVKEPNPNARYRNVHISLKEIIQSNQQ